MRPEVVVFNDPGGVGELSLRGDGGDARAIPREGGGDIPGASTASRAPGPRAGAPGDAEVLIAGAGPTGLVLALWLAQRGVRLRLIDPVGAPVTTSRALAVQARTLELYRQLGLADAVVQRSQMLAAANLWVGGRKAGRIPFGAMGEGQSPFPFALIFPQDEHERLLIDRLAELGVTVERRTELVGFDDAGEAIVARLRRAEGGEETCRVDYLAGCDGAHSRVREVLGAGFPGGTYSHLFYVADVRARGPAMDGELHVVLDDTDFLVLFPLKPDGSGGGRARFIGTVRASAVSVREQAPAHAPPLTWEDVSPELPKKLAVTVDEIRWFSSYRVHHRVAGHFGRGRAFLVGDAGHIHSPVGGQGMNTGIGDAVNLGWKLAAVLRDGAPRRLLDTYEPERIAFARRLVATTDRAFTLVTSGGRLARWMRLRVIPRLLPALFAARLVRARLFRVLSQIAIHYRDSPLTRGWVGRVRGGDRLPWVPAESGTAPAGPDNFATLTALAWQVHVYGRATRAVAEVCRGAGLPLHVFPWTPAAARAGLERDTVYLIRPDGYVGLVEANGRAEALKRYLDVWIRRLEPAKAPR